ncbi:hypothetical protein FA13DRAFT_1721075 [Coprinellus micaceus]|uniref:Uncharacterized protein n=1 Tax=Coprinellus micaceus TaxID=71717 RepID=A0A4Y7S3V2_COPMI|nr:hypothetical protein FA13DRAFT_1721075 [Coprinellus micaceus]
MAGLVGSMAPGKSTTGLEPVQMDQWHGQMAKWQGKRLPRGWGHGAGPPITGQSGSFEGMSSESITTDSVGGAVAVAASVGINASTNAGAGVGVNFDPGLDVGLGAGFFSDEDLCLLFPMRKDSTRLTRLSEVEPALDEDDEMGMFSTTLERLFMLKWLKGRTLNARIRVRAGCKTGGLRGWEYLGLGGMAPSPVTHEPRSKDLTPPDHSLCESGLMTLSPQGAMVTEEAEPTGNPITQQESPLKDSRSSRSIRDTASPSLDKAEVALALVTTFTFITAKLPVAHTSLNVHQCQGRSSSPPPEYDGQVLDDLVASATMNVPLNIHLLDGSDCQALPAVVKTTSQEDVQALTITYPSPSHLDPSIQDPEIDEIFHYDPDGVSAADQGREGPQTKGKPHHPDGFVACSPHGVVRPLVPSSVYSHPHSHSQSSLPSVLAGSASSLSLGLGGPGLQGLPRHSPRQSSSPSRSFTSSHRTSGSAIYPSSPLAHQSYSSLPSPSSAALIGQMSTKRTYVESLQLQLEMAERNARLHDQMVSNQREIQENHRQIHRRLGLAYDDISDALVEDSDCIICAAAAEEAA